MIKYSNEEGFIKSEGIRDKNDERKEKVILPKTAIGVFSIKLMNDINDNKKSFEDILVKEKASRGTFNVFATDKEKEAEQSIEKLNKEFDKLSDQFNARILPQIKEYGVDLKEIEQRKIAEKENQNKIEQEKIQKDLEEKLRSFGGM